MTKQQTIELLKQQMPGFYSVEQVIEMISKIEETNNNVSFEAIERIAHSVTQSIVGSRIDLISNYDLSIDYHNRIDLDDIEIDEDQLNDIILAELRGLIEENKN